MAKRQDVKMVWTHGKKGSDDAFFVRASVFMVEQGFQVEFDDTDNISWHLAVYDGDEPIGAARIFLGEDKVWQIGRVCVLENYRGRKLGDKILEACEQKIVELRFGLGTENEDEMTQKEVADLLGISQSYISRLEKKIMKRLKKEIVKYE